MVETLKNRLNDEKLDISDIGLVIVDEAHYNSFTKIFKFFDKSFIFCKALFLRLILGFPLAWFNISISLKKIPFEIPVPKALAKASFAANLFEK